MRDIEGLFVSRQARESRGKDRNIKKQNPTLLYCFYPV
jgi:hypothetical protein